MHKLLIGVGFLLAISSSFFALQNDPFFFETPAFLSPDDPLGLAGGDLDGNGWNDLVIADQSANGIQIHLQVSLGVYAPVVNLGAGSGYRAVDLADLNGDGNLDLVAADTGTPSAVLVALGDGSGALVSLKTVALSGTAEALALGDLNSDGHPDLVVALSDIGQVAVLLGQGDGTFSAALGYPADVGVIDVDFGDINADGSLDVVAASQTMGTLIILFGDGTGGLSAPNLLPGLNTAGVRAGDLDGDGDLDLVSVSNQASLVVTFSNLGSSFGSAQNYFISESAESFDLTDLDNDGDLDLAIGPGGGGVLVAGATLLESKNDGTGVFDTGIGYGESSPLGTTGDLLVTDLDGDGNMDVVTNIPKHQASTMHFGDGAGGIRVEDVYAVGNEPRAFKIADMNADGLPDLVCANFGTSTSLGAITINMGNAGGTFGVPVQYGIGSMDLDIDDLNLDGVPDVVLLNTMGTFLCSALGIGDGSLGGTACITMSPSADRMVSGDIDGDGIPDVLAVSQASSLLSIVIGDGTGRFIPGANQVPLGGETMDVIAVDVDLDGDLDAVVADQMMPGLILLLNDGLGNLSNRTDFPVPGAIATSVLSQDLNTDGFADLVTDGVGECFVLYGLGQGAFATPLSVPLARTSLFALGDVNRDGQLDLIGYDKSIIAVSLADGLGGFRPSFGYESRRFIRQVGSYDLDADGWEDLLVLDTLGYDMRVSTNFAPSVARTSQRNGSGTNALVFASLSAPIIGSSWDSSVDASAFSTATLSAVLVSNRGLPGLGTPYGELLVALPPVGVLVTSSLQSVVAGSSNHSFAIPLDAALVGQFLSTQAALIGPGVSLTNAIDLVLGDS